MSRLIVDEILFHYYIGTAQKNQDSVSLKPMDNLVFDYMVQKKTFFNAL